MKIFVTRPIPEAGIHALKSKKYEVVVNEKAENRPATKEELLEGIKGVDGILSVLTDKIDGEIMDAGFPTL